MSQSIEQTIAANTAALLANTEATLSLLALMQAAGAAPKAPSDKPSGKPGTTTSTKAADPKPEVETDPADVAGPQEDGSVYFADAASDKFGSFPTMAKFTAAKKKNKDIFVISLNLFNEKTADAAEAAAEAAGGAGEVTHTMDDLVACFTSFIAKTLPADVRKERHAFAKLVLAKVEAEKASEIEPEHFGYVIDVLTRFAAGEEVDLEAGEEEEEDGLI